MRWLLFLAILLQFPLVRAQMTADSTASVAVFWANERQVDDPMPKLVSNEVVLPFTMAGRLILIEARVDTTIGNFILDTGAPFLVLNKSWFRKYGTMAMAQAGGITGAISDVMTTMVREVQLGDITYNQVEADVIELSHLENSRGVPILGLLGLNLFKSFELFIDYEMQQIRLYKLDKKGKRLSSHDHMKAFTHFPFYISNNTLLIDGMLGDVPMRFCLDSGAEVNVLHNRLPKKAMSSVFIASRSILTGTGNRKIEVSRGTVQSVHIDKFKSPPMPVLITHLGNMSRAYNLRIDGMLGYDFLSIAPVSINFVTKEITFWEGMEKP